MSWKLYVAVSSIAEWIICTAGVRFPAGARTFSLRHRVQTSSGPTQPVKWVPRPSSTTVKRPEREADHSWYVFMARYLLKEGDDFTFLHKLIMRLLSIPCSISVALDAVSKCIKSLPLPCSYSLVRDNGAILLTLYQLQGYLVSTEIRW